MKVRLLLGTHIRNGRDLFSAISFLVISVFRMPQNLTSRIAPKPSDSEAKAAKPSGNSSTPSGDTIKNRPLILLKRKKSGRFSLYYILPITKNLKVAENRSLPFL